MDSSLSGSQRDIGESSNLAQICQSYSYTFKDNKYDNYVAILSVLAQASIDSAKRLFDINISDEIALIKKDMDIKKYGYPEFWKTIRPGFDSGKINREIHCPMNYLQTLNIRTLKFKKNSVIGLEKFLVDEPFTENRAKARRIEELIEKYQINKYTDSVGDLISNGEYEWDKWLILRSDFDDLIDDLRQMTLSMNYRALVIRLIKRAFILEPSMLSNKKRLKTKIGKNKSLLMKVLYDVNPKLFLSCFIEKS